MEKLREEVGLPTPVFFYTLGQVADLLAVSLEQLKTEICHFRGMGGIDRPDKLLVVDLTSRTEAQIWRVSEDELIRWCRNRGVRLYRR